MALDICHAVYPDKGGSCLAMSPDRRCGQMLYDVEIIIPVYNVENYVAECFDSVLAQKTHFDYHVIVVNDGSTDRSREILTRYECQSQVTIIDQEKKGFSAARNTGLRHAKGRYIMFVDSDDRLAEDAVETLMSAAVSGNYDMVGGSFVRLDGDSRVPVNLDDVFQFGMPWGKVYKAKMWEGVQFPENYWFEDTISKFVIYDRAEASSSVKTTVYEYRINRNSISFKSRGNPKVLDTIYVTLRMLEDRHILGLPVDKHFYDVLLHQFMINAQRVYTLGNRDINYANFAISKYMRDKYYGDTDYHSDKYKEIESALRAGNYKQFVLACLFL